MTLVGDEGVLACYYAAAVGVFPETAMHDLGILKISQKERWILMYESYPVLKELGFDNKQQARMWGVRTMDFNTFKSRGKRLVESNANESK